MAATFEVTVGVFGLGERERPINHWAQPVHHVQPGQSEEWEQTGGLCRPLGTRSSQQHHEIALAAESRLQRRDIGGLFGVVA
jgi:hypothetical protein